MLYVIYEKTKRTKKNKDDEKRDNWETERDEESEKKNGASITIGLTKEREKKGKSIN